MPVLVRIISSIRHGKTLVSGSIPKGKANNSVIGVYLHCGRFYFYLTRHGGLAVKLPYVNVNIVGKQPVGLAFGHAVVGIGVIFVFKGGVVVVYVVKRRNAVYTCNIRAALCQGRSC